MIPILRAALLEAQLPLNQTSRLPMEVLAHIFQQVPRSIIDDSEETRINPIQFVGIPALVKASDVLPITHVCRRWRQIATDMRALWTTVDDRKQMPSSIYVERSRGLPLNVVISRKPSPDVLSCLRGHGSAIQQLHWLSNHLESTDHDCRRDLLLHLPNIQLVTMFSTKTRTERMRLFGNTTSLQRLTLQHFNWLPSNHFPHLTQLYLTNWAGFPKASVFLDFLCQCPNLIDVYLGVLFAEQPFPAMDFGLVELPHLRRLSFYEFYRDDIAFILNHISAPPDIALALLGDACGDEDAMVISHFSAISSCTTAVTRLRHLDGTVNPMVFLSQTAGVYFSKFPKTEYAASISTYLPLDQVHEIWILDDPMLPKPQPQVSFDPAMLRRMPGVRRLVVVVALIVQVSLAIRTLGMDTRPAMTSFEILVNTPDFLDDDFRTCVASLLDMGIPHPIIMIPGGLPDAWERITSMDIIDATKCLACEELPTPPLPAVCVEDSELWPSWEEYTVPFCKLENGSLLSQ